jgi:phenylacetate-CoA ligase
MAADVLHPELIDPDTAAPLPLEAGQSGELVLTHLVRDCQPLVRFRTGDIIRVEATEPCSCGRTGFRFAVVGRSDDMVVVRGLTMFPSMVAGVINEFAELSGEYRIELAAPPPHDVLPVAVELAEGRTEAPDLAARVAGAIKARLGATARVSVRPAGSFPRTAGKTQRVIRGY